MIGYYVFIPIKALLPQAPGSVDQAISVAWMLRATTLLGAACFVADLSRHSTWLSPAMVDHWNRGRIDRTSRFAAKATKPQ